MNEAALDRLVATAETLEGLNASANDDFTPRAWQGMQKRPAAVQGQIDRVTPRQRPSGI